MLERAVMERGKIVELDADFPAFRALQFLAACHGSFEAAPDLGDWVLRTNYYDADSVGFENAGRTISAALLEANSIENLRLDHQLVVAFIQDVDLMVAVRNRTRDAFSENSPAFSILQRRLPGMAVSPGTHIVFRETTPESNRELDLTKFFDLQSKPLPLIALTDGTVCLRPLLLHGAPGIGKNRFVRRLAEVLSLPLVNFNAGGSADSMSLKGAARGWATSRLSLAAQAIVQYGCANPLICVDELDKEGVGRHNGRLSDALHQLLEPESSQAWYDESLLGACDLSHISWIAAANSIQQLPNSLLSRFDVARPPLRQHYPGIFRGIIVELLADYGIDPRAVLAQFDHLEIRYLCERAKSARHLKRLIEGLLALKIRKLRRVLH